MTLPFSREVIGTLESLYRQGMTGWGRKYVDLIEDTQEQTGLALTGVFCVLKTGTQPGWTRDKHFSCAYQYTIKKFHNAQAAAAIHMYCTAAMVLEIAAYLLPLYLQQTWKQIGCIYTHSVSVNISANWRQYAWGVKGQQSARRI